jgi:hypothetical protein
MFRRIFVAVLGAGRRLGDCKTAGLNLRFPAGAITSELGGQLVDVGQGEAWDFETKPHALAIITVSRGTGGLPGSSLPTCEL